MQVIYRIFPLLAFLIVAVENGECQDTINSVKAKKEPLFHSTGNVGLGYDYGVLPFYQNFNGPTGYFKADGNINLEFKSLPFITTFFYTNLKNVNGLNNYFRVSFDLQTYRSNLLNRKDKIRLDYLQKLPELNANYQLLQQKIGYLDHVSENLEYYYQFRDSLSFEKPDSLDSFNLPSNLQLPIDSTRQMLSLENYRDSILNKKADLINKSNDVKDQIENYQQILNMLENPTEHFDLDTLIPMTKTERFFSHLKKFDVGMCYPSYSTFLVSNIPVKGVNFEYENKNKFIAFTAGTTINNLLFTNNLIQNNLQNTQNLFNYLDFVNPTNGRRILSAKAGWGAKESDHLFIGALYGTGMQSYYLDSLPMNGQNQKEHNVVFEVDGKIKPRKWIDLDLIYGKSSIRPLTDESDSINTSISQLFSSYRSNAFLGKSTFSLDKLRSSFTLSIRWVDPFFRSFGIGFMRSDNLRYELRSNHYFGKKWKAGFFYRKDENNLLNLYTYKTILHSAGANLRYKLGKSITISALFNPVFQNSTDDLTGTTYHNQNYIMGFSANHSYQKKKLAVLSTLTGNYYQLYNGISNSEYVNISAANTINTQKWMFTISASYFDMKGMDSLTGNTVLLYNDLSHKMNKFSLSGGLKLSINNAFGQQLGYHARVEARIMKHLALEIRGEKMVLGDFYNSVNPELFRTYPYYWSGKVIINW